MPACYGFGSRRPSRRSPSPPLPQLPPASHPPSENGYGADPDAGTPRSGRGEATSASPTTFNLLAREFTLAIESHSYAEIWSKIHTLTSASAPGEREGDRLGRREREGGAGAAAPSSSPSADSARLIDEVLRPDRGSVDEALRGARPGRLSRLVSDYFDSSEHTSRLCLRLHRCVDRARSIYAPLLDLLEVLPTPAATTAATTPASSPSSPSSQNHRHHPQQAQHRLHRHRLSQTQCERAFDIFQEFGAHDNPFPAPGSAEEDGASFQEMRRCFAELKQQLDNRLRQSRSRARLLRRTTVCSALCLVGATVSITVSGVLLAVHALPALAAAPLLGFIRLPPAHPLAARQRRLREHIAQLDAAARGTYVLNNDLDTIERLVARLHATVESDRVLVMLTISRGRGDRHPLEQVVGQLRRNCRGLLEQLHDLEEHVCLCFAAINRARSLLLQHIHSHYRRPHHHSGDRTTTATSPSATKEAGEEEEEGQVQIPA